MSKDDKKQEAPATAPAQEKELALFEVPEEVVSVYREGVGLFKTGQRFTLPDAASPEGFEPVSLKLIPCNQAALDMLNATKAHWERRIAEGPKKGPVVREVKPLAGSAKKKAEKPSNEGKGFRAADK